MKEKRKQNYIGVNGLISSKNWLEVLMLLRQLNMAVWEYVEYLSGAQQVLFEAVILPIQLTYLTKANIQVVEQEGIKTKDCPMKKSDPEMFKGENS